MQNIDMIYKNYYKAISVVNQIINGQFMWDFPFLNVMLQSLL